MRLALYQPDIPQNTGTLLRLGACLGVPVDVIGPAGFDLSDRALRRAALDYLEFVELVRHESFAAFMGAREKARATAAAEPGRLILLSARAPVSYLDFKYMSHDTLMLGRESSGCPESVHAVVDARIRIPMRPNLRSLNIAVAGALVVGEALRQTGQFPT